MTSERARVVFACETATCYSLFVHFEFNKKPRPNTMQYRRLMTLDVNQTLKSVLELRLLRQY